MFNISEIFNSIEGEGIRAGKLCTFIRFTGCNLRCSYCDSCYTYDKTDNNMTTDEIINKVNGYGCGLITITGGEPLLQGDLLDLVDRLIKLDYDVNIETNGSMNIKSLNENTLVTLDYKSPSSGMNDRMDLTNFDLLKSRDVLKFVLGSQEDMEAALNIINTFNPKCNIYFSPVFGQIEMVDIVDFMKKHKLNNVYLQIQLHKVIWDPSDRGV